MRIFSACIAALLIALPHTTAANTFKTEKWFTKNGVRVVFYSAMEVPMLDISLAFAAGSAYDENQFGLSALTSRVMNQGNAGQDANKIAESLADVGAQYGAEINRDMVIFSLRTLVDQKALPKAVNTFAQIINHPDFPEQAFAREKKQLLMAIEQRQESPEEVANLHFFQALYQQHPYAHPVNGTAETVNAINKNQVIEFNKRYYVAKNAILVLVGAINSETAHQLADQLTQELPEGHSAPPIPKATQLAKAETVNIPFPSSQTVIRLGQIGIDHHAPNYFPLIVGNYILGGGALVSRLAIEVREKRGLTYGIDSQFVPMSGKGPFLISLSTKNKQTKNALDIIQDVLRTYINKGPTDEEMNAAKQYLTGSFPLSLSGNRSIANILLRMTFYHLPEDFLDTYTDRINSVTSDQVRQAFQQQVNPDKLLLLTVGKS
ncbi:insulinase family protein [Legionella qingyii]|uniref:Insulinase family protein n=1 Tax=Legionella qingyii TaxID=2184757 RepID=A0A317TYT9_9GAMM|nr:pitrilysin family protein [Legionella qingyii]PWY54681.1 insulinase family protein [Legionella qingyii]RUR20415.1 insulinase family protein [Legionella qingyii]RUR29406.1 insulinase family protein [Legionella qingyii]